MDDPARSFPLRPGMLKASRLPAMAGVLLTLLLGGSGRAANGSTSHLPWKVGDTPVAPWKVAGVTEHPEFVRFALTDGSRKTEVEVTFSAGAPGPFATRLYRIQPAPGAGPGADAELLGRLRDELARLEAAPGHQPFVSRLERVDGEQRRLHDERGRLAAGPVAPRADPEEGSGQPRPAASPGATGSRVVFSIGLHGRLLQACWLVLLGLFVPLASRAGRLAGAGAGSTVAAALLAAGVALFLEAGQPPRALHPNGHAWREGRELLSPFGVPDLGGINPYLHGRGGLALQWLVLPRPAGLSPASPSGKRPDPLGAAKLPLALAAASTALLAIVLTGRTWPGLLAGLLSAIHPLSLLLGSSGSTLSPAAFVLPLSLALLVAAKGSSDRLLIAGAGLAGVLAVSSHSAAIFWPAGLAAAWLVLPAMPEERRSGRWLLLAASGLVVVEWAFQVDSVLRMTMEGVLTGAATAADAGWKAFRFLPRDVLLANARWSPLVLLPLALLALHGWTRDLPARRSLAAGSALLLACVPFLAPHACLSDLVRYQGTLVGLLSALGAAGVARASVLFGRSAAGALSLLWLLSVPPVSALPVEPDVLENAFLSRVLPLLRPGTLVELPPRDLGGNVIAEFPFWLLPEGASAARTGSPETAGHTGPHLAYAGLACVSRSLEDRRGAPEGPPAPGMRPACRRLLDRAHPFRTMEISSVDVPLRGHGEPWTFLSIAPGERFGLFVPAPGSR